jgi:hypothetical protein
MRTIPRGLSGVRLGGGLPQLCLEDKLHVGHHTAVDRVEPQ